MTRIYKQIKLTRKASKKKEEFSDLKEKLTLKDLEKIRSKFELTNEEMINIFLS